MSRYTKPQITGTFSAVSTINGRKGGIYSEQGSVFMTNTPAYQSEE